MCKYFVNCDTYIPYSIICWTLFGTYKMVNSGDAGIKGHSHDL